MSIDPNEGNKLIAEFMDVRPSLLHGRYVTFDPDGPVELQYNTSWNWLMDVVGKIEKMYNYEKSKKFFTVDDFDITYTRQYPHHETRVRINICTDFKGVASKWYSINTQSKDKTEAVWQAVVEFIQWYNQNNKIK